MNIFKSNLKRKNIIKNEIKIIIKSKFPGKKERKIIINADKINNYYFKTDMDFRVFDNIGNKYFFECRNKDMMKDFKNRMENIFIKRVENILYITNEDFYIKFNSYCSDGKYEYNGRYFYNSLLMRDYCDKDIYLIDHFKNVITYEQRDKIYNEWKCVHKYFVISYIYLYDKNNKIYYFGESVGRKIIKDNKEETNLNVDGNSVSLFKSSSLSARSNSKKFKNENKVYLIMVEFNPFKYYHLILKEEKIALISGKYFNDKEIIEIFL